MQPKIKVTLYFPLQPANTQSVLKNSVQFKSGIKRSFLGAK